MEYRGLGKSGLRLSAVSFGAGPVPALMTKGDAASQVACVERALALGINWFDTAATYGDGASEQALASALAEVRGAREAHLATKVRLAESQLGNIRQAVEASLAASLKRLRIDRVTLLQLHNSVTLERGSQPTSLALADVLGAGGVLEAFESLRGRGLVEHLGLTGLGDVPALLEVLATDGFTAMQVPYNMLNASADGSRPAPGDFDYGNLIGACAEHGVGVLAIRVFAGGALAGKPPSDHTRTTKFFPLALYERDKERAAAAAGSLPDGISLPEAAVRFVLSNASVSSALVGFSSPGEIDDAVRWAARGRLV
jgi:aryl-alcohol dehydrogenase-like predicted oxidoreductase